MERYGGTGNAKGSRLGFGDTTQVTTFKQIKFNNGNVVTAKYISLGTAFLQIQGKDGKTYVVGYNSKGELSNGTTATISYLTPMLNNDTTEVIDAILLAQTGNAEYGQYSYNTAIVRADGTVWVAGTNLYGQYGDLTTVTNTHLTQCGEVEVDLNTFHKYMKVGETFDIDVIHASGFNVFLVQDEIESNWSWKSSNSDVATINNNGVVSAIAIGTTTITGTSIEGYKSKVTIEVYRNGTGIIAKPQVAYGNSHAVVLKEDGTVWAVGDNDVGQLGNGTKSDSSVPVQVLKGTNSKLENVIKIAVGEQTSAALTTEGKVYAWGLNNNAQLSQGNTKDLVLATTVKIKDEDGKISDIENITDIAVGSNNLYMLTEDGNVYGVGLNGNYQIDYTGTKYTYPVLIENAKRVVKINAGHNNVMFMKSNGQTYMRGNNANGQRGDGTVTTFTYVSKVGNDISDFVISTFGSVIVKEDSTIWATGTNKYGYLGLNNTAVVTSFTQVMKKYPNGTDTTSEAMLAKYISMGTSAMQVLGKDGVVYSCGFNEQGQLGVGTTTTVSVLTPMLNSDNSPITDTLLIGSMVDYDTKCNYNIALIRTDGTVWVAGRNTSGEIGYGTTSTLEKYLLQMGKDTVELNVKNKYIKVGETLDVNILTAEGFNVFLTDTQVKQDDWTWESSNNDVATINNDGNVTGKALGYTTIVGTNKKNGLKAKALINVYRNIPGAITVPQIEEGELFTVVLKEDGTVWATGQNKNGQLGQGNKLDSSIPVQVKIDENTYLENVRKISANNSTVYAMTVDGKVYGWGYNPYGQLGQGNKTELTYATLVRGLDGNGFFKDAIDISVGMYATYIIDEKGIVYGVGYSRYNAIDSQGGTYLYPVKMPDYSNAFSVSAGTEEVAIRETNASVWKRGYNGYGVFGNGNTTSGTDFVGKDINDICEGRNQSVIIKEDGTVWATGINSGGQLGVGDNVNKTTYTQVKLEDGTEVNAKYSKAGSTNLIILTKNNELYATGNNSYGAYSNGTKTTTTTFYPVRMLNKDNTVVSDAMFVSTNGYAGDNNYNKAIVRTDGTVWVTGKNNMGQIGNATTQDSLYFAQMGDGFLNYPEKWIELYIGETNHIDMSKFSYGDNMNVYVDSTAGLGQLSFTIEDSTIATLGNDNLVTGVSVGYTRVVVTDTSTGVSTYIWIKVVDEKNVEIDAGYKFSVAVKSNGTVWTWGQNNLGQLGLGDATTYTEPQQVSSITEKIIHAKAGYNHVVALTEDGEVYTWGYNRHGELGNNSKQNSLVPVKIEIPDMGKIIKVDAYKYMSIALNDNGEVFVWGNGYGTVPVKLNLSRKIIDISGDKVLAEDRRAYSLDEKKSYGSDLIKIATGKNHYLGLTSRGEVVAWGTNTSGQLGDGTNTSTATTTKVLTPDGLTNISNIVEISAGDGYSIICDKDGNIYTFGYDSYWRLGQGTTRNKPELIEQDLKIELIAASEGAHTLISDWDGFVYSVGLNDNGQLGLKDKANRSSFEIVGDIELKCNPNRISVHVNEVKSFNVYLNNSFNLKTDVVAGGQITKSILNTSIAELDGDNVIGKKVGKTILHAKFEGIVGNVSNKSKTYYKNIEIEVLPEGGVSVPKVESGKGFTVALKADGTVWAWGSNEYGQLGQGNNTFYNEPMKIEISEIVKDIAVGDYQVLAIGESGKVYSWGCGNNGQLGAGNTKNYTTPVTVLYTDGTELTDIIKVEATSKISFAIDSKGNAYAFGEGYGKRAVKLETVDNVIDITSKFVLDSDGEIYNIETKDKVGVYGKIIELDEGTDHIAMLTTDNTAYCIGNNTYGQLGNGNNIASEDTPVAVRISEETLLNDIREIKAGDKNTIIVTNDGKIYTVGINDNYELGIDNTTVLYRNYPEALVQITDSIMCDAGDNFMTIVRNNGTVWSWGLGTSGQLGNRRNLTSIDPVMAGDYMVRTNTNHVVLAPGETKLIEGYVDYFNILNSNIINLSGTSKDTSVATIAAHNSEDTTEPYTHKFIISGKKVGTTVVTLNQANSTNIGVIQVEIIPEGQGAVTYSDGKRIEPNVVTNGSHTITLRVDGKVYTWGDNTYGVLGNGTTKESDEPVEVTFPEETIIKQIAAGENHNVALDTEGNVWTWGSNQYWQIGHTGGNQYTPYKVKGLPKVIRIAAGNYSTMVITEDNQLYGWGFNSYGNLGMGTYTNKVTPAKIDDLKDIIDISGGKYHFIALNRSGEVFATGYNLYGQLGNGNTEIFKSNIFTKVDIQEKIAKIDAGYRSNIAVSVDGFVYAWGENIYGELGTGNRENLDTATQISKLRDIREAEIGSSHAIVRNGNKSTYVVGVNTYGQLGVGSNDSKTKYESNGLINTVLRVSAGDTYTVFLKENGTVWACGDYNHGSGTRKSRTNSNIPVIVGSDESSLDMLEMTIEKSQTASILANAKYKFNLIYIDDNDSSDFSFQSYNNEIATVDNDGDVLGIREGTTWVKVTDGKNGKEHVVIIHVVDNTTEYTTHTSPKVLGGETFAIGIKEDGSVWTWGYDASGIGYTDIPTNINVLATYVDIDVGKNFGLALRDDGSVWSIGDNAYGQLGIGSNETKEKFVQIEGLEDIKQIAAGASHAIVMDNFGIMYGWGSNSDGQLGKKNIGENINSPRVITFGDDRVIQIVAGDAQTVFVTASGRVYGMGKLLNGYINGLENAVKVQVGKNYILVLRTDGSIYKYQYEYFTKVGSVQDAIDISAKGTINTYLSSDEKAYTWGTGAYGALGNGDTKSIATPALAIDHSDAVYEVGAGYRNTFIIGDNGYVYAAGDNQYGELGNGTSNNASSATFNSSNVHTLVGDRTFEVLPVSRILQLTETEELTVKTDTFNVFGTKSKDLDEYTWASDNSSIVSVLSDGVLSANSLGQANIAVTDIVTGEQQVIRRIVTDLDVDKLEYIRANSIDADIVSITNEGLNYEVTVPMDEEQTDVQVSIKTLNSTDNITIDTVNKSTWLTGSLVATVQLTGNYVEVPFIVKTNENIELNYKLKIIRASRDTDLAEETGVTYVRSGTTDRINAILNGGNYEIIVPKGTALEPNIVTVTTASNTANVSIGGAKNSLHSQDYELVMTKDIEEIPVKVTSESGSEARYKIIAYSEDYAASLKSIQVNGLDAMKVDDTTYQIYIDDLINLSDVKAITNFSGAKIGINNSSMQVHEIEVTNIDTSNDLTIVTVQVEYKEILGIDTNGDEIIGLHKNREYTLNIYKQRTASMIQTVIVDDGINGAKTIPEKNKVYIAYIDKNATEASVTITTTNSEYTIQLDNGNESNGTLTVPNVSVGEHEISVINEVTDLITGEVNLEVENYKLIIRHANIDVGIEDVYTVNDYKITHAIESSTDENTYEVSILKDYTETQLTIVTIDENAIISIDGGAEEVHKSMAQINLPNKETEVTVVVTSADKSQTVEYKVKIVKVSDDVGIKIELDELPDDPTNSLITAAINPYEEDTYEIQLINPVNVIELIATADYQNAEVSIDNGEYVKYRNTELITLTDSVTALKVKIKSESGVEKIYIVNIRTLDDNADIDSIEVNGDLAVYNNETKRYEVRTTPNSAGKYTITATASSSSAIVTIESQSSVNKIIRTQAKKTSEDIVDIQVTSANNLNEVNYRLAIIEKESDTTMFDLKVNGITILPDSDGNYTANVASTVTDVTIYGEATSEHAIVSIDGETNNTNSITAIRNLESNGYVYSIVVEAENGAYEGKQLTINKLSGDTDITSITVLVGTTTYTAEEQEDGTYYAKVIRNSSSVVTVDVPSPESASIEGKTESETIALLDDITLVDVTIIAEDGLQRDVVLKIEKQSDDTTLAPLKDSSNISDVKSGLVAKLTSEDSALYSEPTVTKNSNTSYVVYVDDRVGTLLIDATTNNENAKIKLGTEATSKYVIHTMTDKSIDISGYTNTGTFTINVLPESGSTASTITVTVIKQFSIDIEQIITDDDLATRSELTFNGWIDGKDDIANIVITPHNSSATVQLYKGANKLAEETGKDGLTYIDTTVTGDSEIYSVVVIDPDDSDHKATYVLVVKKKSDNPEIEYIKINNQIQTENVDLMGVPTGEYDAIVGTSKDGKYTLEVKPVNEYASISFDGGITYSDPGTATMEISLTPKEEKTINVVVMSQNGASDYITKTIKIYRQDNNVDINTLNVNGIDILPSYNSRTNNYSITLPNLSSTTLEITTESNDARIQATTKQIISDTPIQHDVKQTLEVYDIELPEIGKTVITFTVVAEDGTTSTRAITIVQLSSDVELELVTVDGKEATQRADGDYEITVGNAKLRQTISAKASINSSKVSINGGNARAGVQTETLNLTDVPVGTELQIPITVIAEDGNWYPYTLYVTVKSGDNLIDYIKVGLDEKIAEEVDGLTNVYRVFVEENAIETPVQIKAADDFAVVKATITSEISGETAVNTYSGNPDLFTYMLTEERNYIPFTVTSESGDVEEYTLQIFKESSDNEIGHVYVDGAEVFKDATTGRYKATVKSPASTPVVKVEASNEFAYVRIAYDVESQGVAQSTVSLKQNSKTTVVPIVVRSQTGVTAEPEYLDIEIMYFSSDVDCIIVDEVEVVRYDVPTKTYTAIVEPDDIEHAIFIMSNNLYAQIEIYEETPDPDNSQAYLFNQVNGIGNIDAFARIRPEKDERILQFAVTGEDGNSEIYNLRLIKKSNNVKMANIWVNDVEIEPEVGNETIYRRDIKKLADKAKVRAKADYPYASVRIGDSETAIGESEVWVDLDLKEDVITIPVLITATDGETIETYNIILTRLSNDCSISVMYDGEFVSKNDDGEYAVSILDNVTEGEIVVSTNNENAKLDINNTGMFTNITKQYNLDINPETAQRTIRIPLTIIAEDETEVTEYLVITRISTNANIEKVEKIVTVEEEETLYPATLIDDEYIIYVPYSCIKTSVLITAESEYATITSAAKSGIGTLRLDDIELGGNTTYVTFNVTAEDGKTKSSGRVKIIKKSDNTNMTYIHVNNENILPDENGIYRATVHSDDIEALLKVLAEDNLADITIDYKTEKSVWEDNVSTVDNESTYVITVTSQIGISKDYTLIITKQTNITGKITTENVDEKYKSIVTVYKTADTRSEDDKENPRLKIAELETQEDGSFVLEIDDIEKYDIVVTKPGYLTYRVTDIETEKYKNSKIKEHKLVAGNVVKYTDIGTDKQIEQIEVQDLVALNDNFGVEITDANKAEYGVYDFNEDGIIDKKDRNILKANMNKKAETKVWVDPTKVIGTTIVGELRMVSPACGSFVLPMACEYTVTSPYGERVHPVTGEIKKHKGIDISGVHHTEILAIAEGEVTFAGEQNGYGYCIEIKHVVDGETIYSFYAHLSQINVEEGAHVRQSQVIGLEGGMPGEAGAGTSTGPHLHFEIRTASGSGHDVNPNLIFGNI